MEVPLNARTVDRLVALNRDFYRDHAASFSDARQVPWPGWERLWSLVRPGIPPGALSVLDVGCGHGRFATFLDTRLGAEGERFTYLGIDTSEPLLERARAHPYRACRPELLVCDPLASEPETALPSGPFALVVLFGFLHHVPSAALRHRLLEALAERVAPGGHLALTSWDFENFERFRRRMRTWEDWNRAAAEPIDLADLEPGDHLLPWGSQRDAVRYCHFCGEAELEDLLASLPLERTESWLADGREGRLNRYFLLRARG